MADMGVIRFTIQGDASPALHSLDRLRSRIGSLNRDSGNTSGYNRMASALNRVGNSAAKSAQRFSKFAAALKRVAFYRVVRSAIKALESAFSEGLQNAYAFSAGLSDAIDGRIATALDGLTARASTMKNQLGAAFGSLLAAIAPIINTLISLITALATAITQLFAAFTGGTFLKAKDTSAKFADNMAKGAGSAKEWKNQLMGFDEINRLEDQSGGGGGGGASGINPNDLFEIAEVEGIFARIAAKWKELVDSLDFEPLLNAWDRLKAAVSDFVDVVMSGLAWVWDNILVPLAHWTIEKGLPSVINMLASAFEFLSAALKFLAPYAQWVWDHFLQPLAKWTGDLFIKAINTITDLFEKLTRLLNGETSFGEFLDSIDGVQFALLSLAAIFAVVKIAGGLFGTAMKLLSSPLLEIIVAVALVVAAFKKFKDALDKIREAGKLTVDSFSDLLAGAGYLALAIGLFTNPWIAVGGAIALVVSEIIKHWDELVEWWHSTPLYKLISDTWENIKTAFATWRDELGEIGKNIWEGFKEGISNAITGIGTWLKDHVWTPFIDGFKSVFGLASPSTEMEPYGHYIWEGVLNGIKNAVLGIGTWIRENIWEPFKSGIAAVFSVDVANLNMDEYGQNIVTGLKNGIINGLAGLGEWLYSTLWSPIAGALNDVMRAISDWWNNISSFFDWAVTQIRTAASNIFGGSRTETGHHPGKFASGGFPESGQLFIAREAGPELVGTANGRTAVASNNDIFEGIKAGVFEAVTAAMGSGSGGNNQPVVIYLDGKEIARTTTKYQNQMARAGA